MDMLFFMRIMDIIQLSQQKLELALMILISLTWLGNMNMDQLWETVLVINLFKNENKTSNNENVLLRS